MYQTSSFTETFCTTLMLHSGVALILDGHNGFHFDPVVLAKFLPVMPEKKLPTSREKLEFYLRPFPLA